MSRELRERLEAAQGRLKSLRDSLPSTSEPSPLPEDLASIEALTSELGRIEKATTAAADRTALARAARDEAAREVLRLEPVGTLHNVAIPVALASGLLAGVALMVWWLELPFGPFRRVAWVVPLAASTVVLLRGAWRSGRVSGARGPR